MPLGSLAGESFKALPFLFMVLLLKVSWRILLPLCQGMICKNICCPAKPAGFLKLHVQMAIVVWLVRIWALIYANVLIWRAKGGWHDLKVVLMHCIPRLDPDSVCTSINQGGGEANEFSLDMHLWDQNGASIPILCIMKSACYVMLPVKYLQEAVKAFKIPS